MYALTRFRDLGREEKRERKREGRKVRSKQLVLVRAFGSFDSPIADQA